ncbi:hypothetical protein [Falsiroseomonas selenitidurans]|uniref:Uncharacterized protein n=1 Tax=Falsiroseomonas selenitidurans TaxID=2716335 RepID=A0ABX1E1U3_9PROT|nr:hypothetical protein [Falsiroseomonas selenitidurans]NKC29727.1 hypothetical protein [Falsiroseomonas selenitidurans]
MKRNLIVPALLALGFAGGALPAGAFAQGPSQGEDWRGQGMASPSRPADARRAYERYLRQLHDDLIRDQDARSARGDSARQGGGQAGGASSGSPPGWEQSGWEQSAWQQFARGYRAGRAAERRSGGGSAGRESRSGPRAGADRASAGGRREGFFVIPNAYPPGVPFQRAVIVPDRSRAMDSLLAAAQNIRVAIQALARQPAGDGRDQAIAEMQDALLETQQAMLRIPAELR